MNPERRSCRPPLRQLIMFSVDEVVEEDRRLLASESITLQDGRMQSFGSAARHAFAIFEDQCPFGNSERP